VSVRGGSGREPGSPFSFTRLPLPALREDSRLGRIPAVAAYIGLATAPTQPLARRFEPARIEEARKRQFGDATSGDGSYRVS
jgi:hypothetical protein